MFDYVKLKRESVFILISIVIIIIALILGSLSKEEKLYIDKVSPTSGQTSVNKLIVNEVMSSNDGAYSDENGKLYDWIELYNGTTKDIDLHGYILSDSETKSKWSFPEVTIKSKSYLVVNLTGENKEGLNANFKISNGEMVVFRNVKGKVVDAVKISNLEKNKVLARDLNGKWYISEISTPGFVNTKGGREEYLSSLYEESNVKINEILPNNNGNFLHNSKFCGFVELINEGKDSINLENYSISNNKNIPFKFQMPSIVLKPNEVKAIYLNCGDEIDPKFKLDSKNGVAILTNNKGKIIDTVEYSNLPNGMAIKRQNSNIFKTNVISPGYLNTVEGEKSFSEKDLKNNNDLIINEIMNNNFSYLSQNGGEYYDWIELKNNGSDEINLSDYSLSSTENNQGYKLPDIKLKPGQIYVVMASGEPNFSNDTYTHLDFKLSENESLYLYKKDNIIDSIYIANIPVGYSMGRNDRNGYYYFENPTPLEKNNTGVIDVSIAPSFSKEGGIYNDVENLTITMNTSGDTYYTTDGSVPNRNSKYYDNDIIINSTMVIKAVTYENDKIISPVVTKTYIVNENHTLPVLSVSVDEWNFRKIKSNPSSKIEVGCYVELYENNNSFSIPCGIQLFGGETRYLPKQSYALKFKKKYGKSSLKYNVFNTSYSEFNTLVVRSGSQDYNGSLFRDELLTSLANGTTNVSVQEYKPVILYINGAYNGIYFLREKVDDEFISNHYNVSEGSSNIVRIDNVVSDGSISSYRELINWIENHDLSVQANYEYVKTKININSFCDFWALETYTTNNDIINQKIFFNKKVDNGKINYIYYDLDCAMYFPTSNYYNMQIDPNGMSEFNVSTFLMRNLMKNAEFKHTYVERISYVLNNVYTKEKLLNKIDELYEILKPEMERECSKWNKGYDEWEQAVQELKTYVEKRTKIMINQTKSYFQLSNDDMDKYFGDL